jgi:hypothetical protein
VEGGKLENSNVAARKNVLHVCETVELACAKLYHHFADLFKEDRENLLLWLKTAMEEENHARLFALAYKLRNDDVIEAIEIKLAEVEGTLLHVRSLIRKVKRRPPTMAQALLIAIELEIKLGSFRTENVIKFSDESYDSLFKAMTIADSQHLQALQEAYDRILIA